MSENVFIPKIKQRQQSEQEVVIPGNGDDIGTILEKVAQYAVIALFGLLPVFFTPGLWASLGFDKALLTIGISTVVIIAISLLTLRKVKSQTVLPIPLIIFWGLVLTAVVSGYLSGDVQDALRGSVLETQTAAFLGVLGLAMTIPLVLQGSKIMSIKAVAFFAVVAALLLTYNILRLVFGAEFLAFTSFGNVTISPIGGFNDLAIFSGLVIVLSLVTLVQLPLKAWLQHAVVLLIIASLCILAVVNFFNIWIVVGFFALLMFIYLLSRDTLFRDSREMTPQKSPRSLVIATMIVCVVSVIFIVAGEYVGGKVNQLTEVNYFEVQPTLSATVDIAQSVYGENIFLGAGPNRFTDAWRQYKDRSINETLFWDTDFSAGGGFISTLFVNLGLLGGLLITAFHLGFLYLGYKILLRSKAPDTFWYYLGVFSFTAACFIWGMSYVYVPGAAILLLGALFTGLTYVAAGSLLPEMVRTIPLAANRQRGFMLMAAIILVITTSIGVLFSVSKQYVAEAHFGEAQATAESVAAFETVAFNSFGLYPDDRFVSARAQIQLADISSLLNIQSPSEEEQKRFLTAAGQAIEFAELALQSDSTNPDNYAVIASIYSNLAMAGIDGALERADSALEEAKRLDPFNPGYYLIAAQLAARMNNLELAREEIKKSLDLKNNYTEALYLSAQLDIGEGKVESAIATTRSIVTLEPNNPTRYFQLGVLLSANNNFAEAVEAFKVAVDLNPVYANARYLLAQTYLQLNQFGDALEQLRIVQQTNSENQELNSLISQIESGEYVHTPNSGLNIPVTENSPSEGFGDTVTTDGDVDSDLVTPVNVISGSDDSSGEVSEEEAIPVIVETEESSVE